MKCYVVSLKFLVHGPKFAPMGIFAVKATAINFRKKLVEFFQDPYANMVMPEDIELFSKIFPQCEWEKFSMFYIDEILLEECELLK